MKGKSVLLVLCFMPFIIQSVYAATIEENQKALPYFASIKSSKVNSRIGPGLDYIVIWHYWRKNLPVQIIEKYDNWRRIKDIDGDKSWIHSRMLSTMRTVVIKRLSKTGQLFVPIFDINSTNGKVITKAQEGAIGRLITCDGNWCKIAFKKVIGYVNENLLWGVFPHEVIN